MFINELYESWEGDRLASTKDEHGEEVLSAKGQEQLQQYKDQQAKKARAAEIAKNTHDEPTTKRSGRFGMSKTTVQTPVWNGKPGIGEAAQETNKHKVIVTLSDPDHTAVSKRKETIQRRATVTAPNRQAAIDGAIRFYKKQGYKVHDAEYHSPINERKISEDINPQDVIKVDVPLFIRLLEYAREEAKTDMDLHVLTDNLIKLCAEGNTITMDQYNEIVSTGKSVTESHHLQFGSVNLLTTQDLSKHLQQKFINYRKDGIMENYQAKHGRVSGFRHLAENESYDEFKQFITQVESIGLAATNKIAVGDKLAILYFDANFGFNEVEMSGFAEPEEVAHIEMNPDDTIKFIRFRSGKQFPRAPLASFNGKPIDHSVLFSSKDSAHKAITFAKLSIPQEWELINLIKG